MFHLQVVICWLLSSSLAFHPVQLTADDASLKQSAREILEIVSELRQLEILGPVENGVASRAEIKSFLIQRIREEYPREEILAEEKLLKRLGLIPEEMDLHTFMLDLLTEQVAGYYDPNARTFYIADWIPLELQKPVMAHELTHALQDQHFNLKSVLLEPQIDDDRLMARASVVEGEGFAVMMDFVLQPLGQTMLDLDNLIELSRQQLSLASAQFKTFAEAPAYLRETLIFPYTYGARFIQAIRRARSWEGVSELYSEFPVSTEQILHPSRYLNQKDVPTACDTGSLRSQLSGNWKSVYKNVLGEFSLFLLLHETLEEDLAREATEGWDGDSVELMETKTGEKALLLSTEWDSEEDAVEFFKAYSKLLSLKYAETTVSNESPAPEAISEKIVWQSRSIEAGASRRGTKVEIWEVDLLPSQAAGDTDLSDAQ